MLISWITFGAPQQRGDSSLTSTLASLRYRVLAPVARMGGGHNHQIIPIGAGSPQTRAEAALKSDAIIFSKSFDASNEDLARSAKARGIPVIFDVCDNHYDHPEHGRHYRAMTELADQVICSTEEMKCVAETYAQAPPIVINDPHEGPRGAPRFQPGERLQLLWFGHPTNLDSLQASLDDLAGYSRRRPVSLRIMTTANDQLTAVCATLSAQYGPSFEVSAEAWSLDAQWAALAACDAVVIPTLQTQQKKVKSANRLVEGLWAGRPVIAQPSPAYLPYQRWTPVCETLSEGLAALEAEPAAWPGRITQAQAEIALANDPATLAALWEGAIRATKTTNVSVSGAAEVAPVVAAPVRLNLGCGDKILQGFVNVDVVESRAGKKPDVICDLHQLTPFEDNSADEIMAIHVVEHFWRWEVVDVLKEWVRVLKPGGKMILECPNLISACEAVLADPEKATLPGPEGQRSMWVLYGDPRWQDPLMVHRWGYTPRSLAQIMHDAGLRDLRQEPAQFKLREPRDMRITGLKPQTT